MGKLTALVCLLLAQPAPLFDLDAILAPPLDARVLKSAEKDGVITEEVRFHSETDGAKKVDLFAIFAYPKGARSLPAFVWNQGGLYQATPHFPELGARRGYAVLCIDFPIPGYRSTGGYPINSGLELTDDPKKAPIYHGAVALLRAVSYLQSRPEVDRDRVGMAGSSWGGFYTTLMLSLDPRLKVGSSMFGCGALDLGNSWWDGQGRGLKRDDAFRRRWRQTLDPAARLAKSKAPLAIITGTNDSFYWLPAVAETHRLAPRPKHLSLLPNWNHALTPALDEQVFAWLDVFLKGAPPFLTIEPLLVKEDVATWKVRGRRRLKSAQLLVSYGGPGNWSSRHWVSLRAAVDGAACEAKVPVAPVPCFVVGNVTDESGFVYSTPPVQVAGKPGAPPPDYDGCSAWGGFEEKQVEFLRLHGLPVPPLVKDAKSGSQAGVLKAGLTTLGPVHFTAGLRHTFSTWVKGDAGGEVAVRLVGSADGKAIKHEAKAAVGKEWREVRLDLQAPTALAASLRAAFVVPKGMTVTADDVSLRPAR